MVDDKEIKPLTASFPSRLIFDILPAESIWFGGAFSFDYPLSSGYNSVDYTRKGERTMATRFIAFDVETPNSANDRMSAIGITVVEDGEILQRFSTLINPETYFHPFNIQLTGITPDMASAAPTFPELWETIEPMMSSGVLIAHNAPFDMRVLSKCLRAYGIQWQPTTTYACTCRMGKACYPALENHRLNTLCYHLHIPLNHHDAGSDSEGCAKLLVNYLKRGLDITRFLRRYDMQQSRTLR